MRYNNSIKLTDTHKIILPIAIATDSILGFRFDVSGQLIPTDISIEQKGNYNFITFTMLSDDSYFILLYQGGFEVLRVGAPPTILFTYTEESLRALPYTQYNYQGVLINSGSMVQCDYNIYALMVTSVIESFFVIGDTITTLTLPTKYFNTTVYSSGSITLERGVWQLISIPEAGSVKEIFLDRLAAQEGVDASELIEVVSAYPGHVNKFLSYNPGFTSDTSEHNFQLLITDGTTQEITAFWVKCREWTHKTTNIIYSWSNVEGDS